LGFKELKADSQGLIIVNPKYWLAAILGGIFYEIWPFEDRHDLLTPSFDPLHLSGVNQNRALWTRIFTFYESIRFWLRLFCCLVEKM
jgi:hypothetical protein